MEQEFDIIIRMNGTHQLRNYADVNSLDKNINIIMSTIKYMLDVVGMLVKIRSQGRL
jgi:hypothetical protein